MRVNFRQGGIFRLTIAVVVLLGAASAWGEGKTAKPQAGELHLTARSRAPISPESATLEVIERPLEWDAHQTAVIVIDVWDKHWCEGANRRLTPMIPRMNALVSAMRDKGALIIHAPSDTMKTYEGTPGRTLAQSAPAAPVPPNIKFQWNYIDPAVEGKLPIDDSDGGCDDEPANKSGIVWKGEHPGITIKEGDAISDKGQEIYNLIEQRGVKNVIIFGVHANMCILGRSFGIRQMTKLGKNVVLVRDLTDTMYNPKKAPFVPHDRGTQLVIEHTERFWCPTILSSDILGDAKPKHVVLISAEQEYHAKDSLPVFAKNELEKRGLRCTVINSDSETSIPELSALDDADLLVTFLRRRTLPDDQLGKFKAWFDAGKPVVALRTSSHGFQNWMEFDKQVLGGNYEGHFGTDGETAIAPAEGAASNPLLRGVTASFVSHGSLYKNTPLAPTATPMLIGKWKGEPSQPVAWANSHLGGRVFYTSLGHPDDFNDSAFRRLLLNGVLWALDQPIPKAQ